MLKILSLLAVLAVFTGCSRNNGPAVNLVTVHFKEASALETTTDFIIRLSNDTPEPEKFTGSAHKIYINGLYVGKGLSADTIEVPRLGSVTQAITVHLSNLALATRIKSVIDTKAFQYQVDSTFFGDSIFKRLHSQTSGKLAWEDFMPASDTNSPGADNLPPPPAVEAPAVSVEPVPTNAPPAPTQQQ